jgi:hypothetical protein
MNTKMLLLAALVGAAAMSANAGVRFGFSIGLPLPVVVSTPVVVCATPVIPAPVTVVQTVPPCASVDYVWMPGYWASGMTGRVWVPGAWCHRPAHVKFGHYHAGHRW